MYKVAIYTILVWSIRLLIIVEFHWRLASITFKFVCVEFSMPPPPKVFQSGRGPWQTPQSASDVLLAMTNFVVNLRKGFSCRCTVGDFAQVAGGLRSVGSFVFYKEIAEWNIDRVEINKLSKNFRFLTYLREFLMTECMYCWSSTCFSLLLNCFECGRFSLWKYKLFKNVFLIFYLIFLSGVIHLYVFFLTLLMSKNPSIYLETFLVADFL